MDFEHSPRSRELQERLLEFMDAHIYPNEHRFHAEIEANRCAGNAWQPTKVIEELKPKAHEAGLWNLFLPRSPRAPNGGLSNLDYAPLCEIMGRVHFAPEVFNCSAPDTGNMETFERYGSEELKRKWLDPLLRGEIRSAFLMTEPDVASSDATNIQSRIERRGDDYVINGRKWWSSGAGDPRCKVYIVMGKTDPNAERHKQQSMIIVPSDTPGIKVERALSIFGYDDAPHGHMRGATRGRDACPRPTSCSARGAASRSRKDGWGPAASTIACARSARRSARSNSCAGGSPRASRSASRSPSSRSGTSASPRRAA